MKQIKTIWIVDEGSPGHIVQSRSFVEELNCKIENIKILEIKFTKRFPGFIRIMLRLLMGPTGRSSQFLVNHLVSETTKIKKTEGKHPDLIVSSGGRSAIYNRLLSNIYSCPNIFIGERKPYPSTWFHTVFTPSIFENDVNDVQIDLIPTGVTPEKVAKAASHFSYPPGRLWSMIIGGDSRSHRYHKEDWEGLGLSINEISEKQGVRWLLTTSRRTGRDAESILKKTIQNKFLADVVWWSERPEKKMHAYLGHSEHVFVTQDSVTMITECIQSGKAVTAICPRLTTFNNRCFIPKYIDRIKENGLLQTIEIDQLSTSTNMAYSCVHRKTTNLVAQFLKRL